jgi:hypothetical protein
VTLALALGPYSHARSRGILFAIVLFSPIMLLRRWPLPVLAAAVAADALVMADGIPALSFGIMLGFGSYLARHPADANLGDDLGHRRLDRRLVRHRRLAGDDPRRLKASGA